MAIEITPRDLGTVDTQMCTSYTIDRLNLKVRWAVSEGAYEESLNALGNNNFRMMGNFWESVTNLLTPELMAFFVQSILTARPNLVAALEQLDLNHDLTDPQGQINLGICMNLLDDVFQGAIEAYFSQVWLPAHQPSEFNPVPPPVIPQ